MQPAPAPQLGPGDMHNAQVAAQAPQLMAALRQAAAQPLSWSSRPFGSNAGPQRALFCQDRDNLELDRWRLCLTIRSPTP